MKDLEINIQEFAFLISWPQEKASEFFKQVCEGLNRKYERKMRLTIETLAGTNKPTVAKLVTTAIDIKRLPALSR